MKIMRVTALALAMLANPLTSSAAGVPVVDALANLERINEWTQHLQQWQSTVTHYQAQLNAYKSQLAAATGIRDVQAFFSQAKGLTNDLKNLQKNGISLNDLLTNTGAYTSELNSLYKKYEAFDTCGTAIAALADICKQQVINQAVAVENTSQVQDKISNTVNDIASLASRIEASPDTKESQDLANAISVKSVQLNTLTTLWEMQSKQAEQRQKLLEQKLKKVRQQQQSTAPIRDFGGQL